MSKKNKKKSKKPKSKQIKLNYKPTISVCLIVKDEERFLDNCLKSVKDIADEIIIIDTGSQDNTVSIAKKYTDKVYFHPWQENFAEARNHYFKYAAGDWIFHIDADEELVKEDIPVLRKAVKDRNVDLILIPIISHLEKGETEGMNNGERLFRNNNKIHYKGRIHERLYGYKSARVYPARLIHYGYDLKDNKMSEQKNQTRIRLLKLDIQDDPSNPLPWHYLSCSYIYLDLYEETIDAGLKAIELADKNGDRDPVYLWTRYNTAMAYYKLLDFKNAESMCLTSIAKEKLHMDSYYLLTAINFDQSKWTEVIKYGNEYLRLNKQVKTRPEDFGTIVANSYDSVWKIQILMGIALNETDNAAQSDEMFRTALLNTSSPFNARKTIGTYYFNKGIFDRAQEHLKGASDLNKDDQTVNGLLESIKSEVQSVPAGIDISDRKQQAECIKNVQNEKEFEELKKLLSEYMSEGKPEKAMELIQNYKEFSAITAPMLCRIAVLYVEKKDLESALKCYMSSLEIDPDMFEAWESLGAISSELGRHEDAQIFFNRAREIQNSRKSKIQASDPKISEPGPGSVRQKSYSSSNKNILTIAIVDIPQNITSGDYFYRTFSPGMALSQEKDVYVVSISNIHPHKFDVINNVDVLILNNICDPDLLPVIKIRKEKGLLTVFELSDDLNAVQPWNVVYEFYQKKENIDLIYRLANYCDKLQFSVHELQRLYGKLNPSNEVFPNQILDLLPKRVSNTNDEFIIGWGGSHGHLEDMAFISEQLMRWVQENQKAKLYIMGSKEIQEAFRDLPDHKKKYFPSGSLQHYYAFLSELDVGIAPLKDTAFNRCRSDVKFLEYAVSGVTPVLSDLEPYRNSVAHGETGFLFKDSIELIEILNLLNNNKGILTNISSSARDYVEKNRMQSMHVAERIAFYRNGLNIKDETQKTEKESEELFEKFCTYEGAVRNHQFLTLSNTKFEQNVYAGLALLQDKTKNAAADRYFEEASRLEPNNYLSFLYRASTSPDPVTMLEKAINLEPLSVKANMLLGEEFTRQSKLSEAILAYQRAIGIFPEYDTPLIRAGNLCKIAGDHALADQLFQLTQNYQIMLP